MNMLGPIVNVPCPQGRMRLISQICNPVKILRERGSDQASKGLCCKRKEEKKGRQPKRKQHFAFRVEKKCAEASERVKTCAAHICITERIKRWREMKTRESILLRTLLRRWLTILQKSLCIFLPQGLEKHLTLLTSLPEKARVRDRQKFQDVGKVAGKR